MSKVAIVFWSATGYKTGTGRNCKTYYRKADVMELFSTVNK